MNTLNRKNKIYIIYNKENGDMYCAADSYEAAEQIIKEDGESGSISYPEDMCITSLQFWSLTPS